MFLGKRVVVIFALSREDLTLVAVLKPNTRRPSPKLSPTIHALLHRTHNILRLGLGDQMDRLSIAGDLPLASFDTDGRVLGHTVEVVVQVRGEATLREVTLRVD